MEYPRFYIGVEEEIFRVGCSDDKRTTPLKTLSEVLEFLKRVDYSVIQEFPIYDLLSSDDKKIIEEYRKRLINESHRG